MLIPSQETKENIAEYVLYMWQVEDIIRACKMDIELIDQNILGQLDFDKNLRSKTKEWYNGLIQEMNTQGLIKQGHLLETREVLNEIFYLHTFLLNVGKDENYKKIFEKSIPYMEEFQQVSNTSTANPIELCFNGLYAKLMLKLQKKAISNSTEEAFDAFRSVLSYLSTRYLSMKKGDLNYLMN